MSKKRRLQMQKRPSQLDQWLIDQGKMRAALFNLEPIPPDNPKKYRTPDGKIYRAKDVWRAILSQVR